MKTNQARSSDLAQKLADEYFDIGSTIQILNSRLNEIKEDLSSLKAKGAIDGKIETDDFSLSFQPGRTTHIYPQSIIDAMDEAKSLGLTVLQKSLSSSFFLKNQTYAIRSTNFSLFAVRFTLY